MMPDSEIARYVMDQGLGVVLAFVVFLIYRRDSQRNLEAVIESASAHIQHGRNLGTAMAQTADGLAQQSQILAQQAQILSRIERHMEQAGICPVAHVTAHELQRIVDESSGPRRRKLDVAIDEVRRRASDARTLPRDEHGNLLPDQS